MLRFRDPFGLRARGGTGLRGMVFLPRRGLSCWAGGKIGVAISGPSSNLGFDENSGFGTESWNMSVKATLVGSGRRKTPAARLSVSGDFTSTFDDALEFVYAVAIDAGRGLVVFVAAGWEDSCAGILTILRDVANDFEVFPLVEKSGCLLDSSRRGFRGGGVTIFTRSSSEHAD